MVFYYHEPEPISTMWFGFAGSIELCVTRRSLGRSEGPPMLHHQSKQECVFQ